MRKNVIGSAIAVLAGLVVLALPRRVALGPAPAEPRRAGREAADRADLLASRWALAASLWTDRAGVQCRARAVWAGAAVSARFGSTLRFSVGDALALEARAQDRIRITAASEAEAAARLAELEPGLNAVVRVLRRASFRPQRAPQGYREPLAA